MNQSYREEPFFFACQGEQLLGILARPLVVAPVGVLIIVGGPQYRVGSHRQFTQLARRLGDEGVATLRFDHRGIGDSTGARRSFEDIALDIRAALDELVAHAPEVRRVVLWGLCDAASAACEYAPSDPRVAGLILLNPWVRTEAGEAGAYLRHYYARRLMERAFWRKVGRGEVELSRSLGSLCANIARAFGGKRASPLLADQMSGVADRAVARGSLPDRMLGALESFTGRTLVILAGNDLTAAEFRDLVASSRFWTKVIAARAAKIEEIAEADHTFSSAAWRERVEQATSRWLRAEFGT